MEKRVVVSKRFRRNATALYKHLLTEHSAKTAYQFLDKMQQRIEMLMQHPEAGQPSQKRDVRSLVLQPHNRIYYRIKKNIIELLCLSDMRRKNKPY